MRRPRTLPRLLALTMWHRRRWVGAVLLASLGGVALGGWLRARAVHPAADRVVVEAPEPALSDDGATDGVVLADRSGLRNHEIVRVLAQSMHPTVVVDGARYPRLLVGREWVRGDAIALRSQPTDPLRGFLASGGGTDLDGDGAPDRFWHAVRQSVEDESDHERLDGTLVFEGSRGIRTLALTSSDGWGNARRIAHTELRDLVGTPEPDLLVVLDIDVCEVGPGGHRLVVVTFGGGSPVIAVEQDVHDPSFVGLAQYEVGSARVSGREILVRTVVHDPMGGDPGARPVRVHVERWLGGERSSWNEPLRTTDGGVVTVASGLPGIFELPMRFRVGDGPRWVSRDLIAEAPYVRALHGSDSDPRDWHEWIVIEPR